MTWLADFNAPSFVLGYIASWVLLWWVRSMLRTRRRAKLEAAEVIPLDERTPRGRR